MSRLRVAEFYCGIGGLHFAVRRAIPDAVVVAAFDIDRDSNRVYQLNTDQTPTKVDIGTLSVQTLTKLNAGLWLLSPPCQPFTRQGLQRDVHDPRAKSFLQLLQKLKQMEEAFIPEYILVENVVGFEESESCRQMREVFEHCQLSSIHECILSPEQFGIPYSRPRYFCLARRRPFPSRFDLPHHPPPVHTSKSVQISTSDMICQVALETFLNEDAEVGYVQEKFLAQCSDVLNVVSRNATLLNCFTKSYGGRYFKGTGSVLATKHEDWIPWLQKLQELCAPNTAVGSSQLSSVQESGFIEDLSSMEQQERREKCRQRLFKMLKEMHVRYFTSKEIAAIHGFPVEFTFPEGIETRRQYALLGNSLSVDVVAWLIEQLVNSVDNATGHATMTRGH